MVKAQSVATVAEIADQFRTSAAAVITEYRGLTMKQITSLRKALGSTTQYTVAKNTLVKRAAADAGVQGLDDLFTGPTAIAFVKGEPSDAAKAIREFAKTNPLLVIKGGYLDGKPLGVADVSKIADLESREVLLAKFAGAMKANLAKAVYVFAALPSQMARLAAALQDKRIADGESVPAEAVAPAVAKAAVESPAAEPEAVAPAEAAVDESPVADVATSDDGVVNTELKQAEAASTEAPAEAPVAAEDAVAEAPVAAEDAVAEAPVAAEDAVAKAPVAAEDANAEAPVPEEAAVAEAPVAAEDANAEAPAPEEAAVAEASVDEIAPDETPVAALPTSDDGVVNTEVNQADAASTEAPADLA